MEMVEGTEGSSSAPPRDKVYVAVGENVKENQKNLEWALKKFAEADFIILHIHSPSHTIRSLMGPCSNASGQKVTEFRNEERKKKEEVIQQYMAICAANKVEAENLVVESTEIAVRIVELVAQLDIKILVMGAAADSNFNKNMSEPASRKARFVNDNALHSCRIWFVCKGSHVCTGPVSTSLSQSRIALGRIRFEKLNPTSTQGKPMVKPLFSFPAYNGQSSSQPVAAPQLGRDASSVSSMFSTDNSGASEGSAPTEECDDDDDDGGVNGELNRVSEEITMAQLLAKNAELQQRNGELEKENTSLQARVEAKSSQASLLSTENIALRKKVMKLTDMNRSLQKQNDEAIQAQKHLQEAKVALTAMVKGIPSIPNFLQFNFAELENATNGFAEEMRIGHGGFGTVYKGKLHQTAVAIKILNPDSEKLTHLEPQFYQEIQALTRVRHPNLVALIGACPEKRCLVYEFVEHGSLEDRLFNCSGENPLSCRERLRIAAEICLALLFLHSAKPQPIVHGDLKPANILLDAANKAKIADFGICRFLPEVQRESVETIVKLTNPKGTLGYMDPEFMATKELTFKSDVYAFGIILLQLLTGKDVFGLVKAVETALDNKVLYSILDRRAGRWSGNDASKLSELGLQCCEASRKCRPDLKSKVWGLLERYL